MERSEAKKADLDSVADSLGNSSGLNKAESSSTVVPGATSLASSMQFLFTHNGRGIDSEQTPEEIGMEDGDEIHAVELMDLTQNAEEWVILDHGSSYLCLTRSPPPGHDADRPP